MKNFFKKKCIFSIAIILVATVIFSITIITSKANEFDDDFSRRDRSGTRPSTSTITEEEYRLFASIVYCESGSEKYEGQLAVANVILNRVESNDWPNSLYDVIYQKNQFSPVKNGYLKEVLKDYDQGKFEDKWHTSCIKAVNAALSGRNNIGQRFYFMTPEAYNRVIGSKGYDKITIGNAVFFNVNW